MALETTWAKLVTSQKEVLRLRSLRSLAQEDNPFWWHKRSWFNKSCHPEQASTSISLGAGFASAGEGSPSEKLQAKIMNWLYYNCPS